MLSNSSIPILLIAGLLTAGLVTANHFVTSRSGDGLIVLMADEAPGAETPDPAANRVTTAQARAALSGNAPFQVGRKAYRDGRYESAAARFAAAAGRVPDNPMVQNYQGLTARHLDREDAAERYWQTLLDTNGPYGAAHLNLGLLYASQDRLEDAARHYRRALALNPNHARAHYNFGLLYLQTERPSQAASHLERASRLGSTSLRAKATHHNGRALLATGQPRAARAAFREAISVQPDYVEPRMALASSLPHNPAGLRERARWYREVIILAPNSDTARARHAETLRQMGADSLGLPLMARLGQLNLGPLDRRPVRPVVEVFEPEDRSNAGAAPNMDGAF
ncbi:MAG: tetratricopeptide repeat protein [Salinivenus sp.]